jgi:hypothetical protein
MEGKPQRCRVGDGDGDGVAGDGLGVGGSVGMRSPYDRHGRSAMNRIYICMLLCMGLTDSIYARSSCSRIINSSLSYSAIYQWCGARSDVISLIPV